MCGIAGVFSGKLSPDSLRQALEAMNAAQVHRGPDQGGTFVCPSQGSGLACRRLSLVDIEHGDQPIANEGACVHVVLNGEIYNHVALREELEGRGHHFRSRCDTEVLVHLYEQVGDAMLDRLHGMFALAILDTRTGRLLLARDGPGMKPLYYAETPKGLLFASEVSALFATGLVTPEVDLWAMDTYLAAGRVTSPMSMFRGVKKLSAGHYLVADEAGLREGVFWRFQYPENPAARRDSEYADELDSLLAAAVRSHLAADVPVGSFLSGGWDSSLTTTYAVRHAGSRLKTFSIIFPEHRWADESRYSRLMSQELGTEHHEIEYRSSDFPRLLPKLIRHLEEPSAASPAAVGYQLTALAAGHVKTVLSGEGADELFGGYEWVRLETPYLIRKVTPRWPFRLAAPYCSHRILRRALQVLAAPNDRTADAQWRRALSPREKRALLKPEFRSPGPDLEPTILSDEILASCSDSLQRRLSMDFTGRLAEGILFVSDKISMAHSLEVRMPFLDRSIVDFALRLPSRLKVHRGQEKRVLSLLARRHLPPEIAARRKRGLGYPRSAWSQEPIAGYLRQLLLESNGPFHRPHVEKRLKEWLRPGGDTHGLLPALFLQAWWNEFIAVRRFRPEPGRRGT